MSKITIFGAGITGLSIAAGLPRTLDITIVARDLPGDEHSDNWCSPWGCAGWAALGGSEREQKMQLDTLAFGSKLATIHPESSVRCTELTDVYDIGETCAKDLWCFNRIPQLRELDPAKAHKRAKGIIEVKYPNFVLNPSVFLPWLRSQLEASGVKFRRIDTVRSLGELDYLGHDILINASGLASLSLTDVKDENVVMDRTYTILVKSDFDQSFVRRCATEYVYIFGLLNGTTAIGGISDPIGSKPRTPESVREHLILRAHENLPDYFPSSDPGQYEIIEDLVGTRPMRLPEARIEKEIMDGQKIVHAYGTTAGGYICNFGLAREVARLVDEYLFGL